jgi:hypothetical protein
MPVLIFKKLRPLPNGLMPSALVNSMEEAPIFDDERIAAAARWPLHFPGPNSVQVDAPQLLLRLKDQIVEACTKCQQACYETRKVTKEMAKRMEHQVPAQCASVMSLAEDDAEVFGQATDTASFSTFVSAPSKDAFTDSQTNLQEPPIEQLEIIGGVLLSAQFRFLMLISGRSLPGDVSRSKLASGRIVMCKSAKDRTSMYVTYDEVRCCSAFLSVVCSQPSHSAVSCKRSTMLPTPTVPERL